MRSPTAFSLIEAMATVAIAGIVAAIGVTSLVPVLRRAELGDAHDRLVGFVAQARMTAFTERRCTQVLLFDKTPQARQRAVLRELNSFDCDGTTAAQAQAMESAPLIDPAQPLWIEVDDLLLEADRVVATFVRHPTSLTNAEGAACPPAVTGCRELRFRPNGRVWSSDADLTNDTVTIEVRHLSTGVAKEIIVAGNGVIASNGGS